MSVPTTRQMESPSAVVYLCLSDLGRERGAVASWGRPVHSAPTPAVPGPVHSPPSAQLRMGRSQAGSRDIPVAEQQNVTAATSAELCTRTAGGATHLIVQAQNALCLDLK